MNAELITILFTLAASGGGPRGLPGGAQPQPVAVEGFVRAGLGGDSNVQRRPRADGWGGATVMAGRVNARWGNRGSVTAHGQYELPLGDTDLWAGRGSLTLGRRWQTSRRLTVLVGSHATFMRQYSAFFGGALLGRGAAGQGAADMVGAGSAEQPTVSWLRDAAGETLLLGGVYGPRWLQVEVAGRGQLKAVRGAERYRQVTGDAAMGVRWILGARLAARLKYGYRVHHFRGLARRNTHGVQIYGVPNTALGVHHVESGWVLRLSKGLETELWYQGQRIADNLLGYLDGSISSWGLHVSARQGPSLQASLWAWASTRVYSQRRATPSNHAAESYREAMASLTFWEWENTGVFAQYNVETVSAVPTGKIFSRHLLRIGVVVRLDDSSAVSRGSSGPWGKMDKMGKM